MFNSDEENYDNYNYENYYGEENDEDDNLGGEDYYGEEYNFGEDEDEDDYNFEEQPKQIYGQERNFFDRISDAQFNPLDHIQAALVSASKKYNLTGKDRQDMIESSGVYDIKNKSIDTFVAAYSVLLSYGDAALTRKTFDNLYKDKSVFSKIPRAALVRYIKLLKNDNNNISLENLCLRDSGEVILFKSTSKNPWNRLSNFYGGSEFTYMSQRTKSPALKNLYVKLRDDPMTYEDFKEYRKRLQPTTSKKYAEKGYRDPYYKPLEGTESFARGLLAKLISGCFRTSMKKRLNVVNEMANELFDKPVEIKMKDFWWKEKDGKPIDATAEEKRVWLKVALEKKFEEPFFKDLLLKSGNSILAERAGGRDSDSIFTGKDGMLGVELTKLRKKL